MIPFIIAAIPIEVEPYQEYHPNEWTEINRAAQISTKESFPWWWNKYGCEGTQWYGPEPCKDLTK
tara:strand:+ start:268 stop:462 length:195 start_codon:yes stop_codon:yes gene_type:complete